MSDDIETPLRGAIRFSEEYGYNRWIEAQDDLNTLEARLQTAEEERDRLEAYGERLGWIHVADLKALKAELTTERGLSHELGVTLTAIKAKYAELVADYDAVCLDHEAMTEGLEARLRAAEEENRRFRSEDYAAQASDLLQMLRDVEAERDRLREALREIEHRSAWAWKVYEEHGGRIDLNEPVIELNRIARVALSQEGPDATQA